MLPALPCRDSGTQRAVGRQLLWVRIKLRHESATLSYDFATLLRNHWPRRYRLYRTLCNNGFVSYQELADGSLSRPDRPEVIEFGRFLARHIPPGATVLDIGCGPLATPGYLLPLVRVEARLIGLDIYPSAFEGMRIIGCAEFIPLPSRSLDAAVFATRLDHVCDLDQTFRELRRVLKPEGVCAIWMSERRPYWREFFLPRNGGIGVTLRRLFASFPRQLVSNLSRRMNPGHGILHFRTHGRYWEYPNGSTFYCPPEAIDPFPSWFESPEEVAAKADRHGLRVITRERGLNPDSVFGGPWFNRGAIGFPTYLPLYSNKKPTSCLTLKSTAYGK